MIRAIGIGLAILPTVVWGYEPALPEGAQLLAQGGPQTGIYALPTGPYANGEVPSDRLAGEVRRRSWRIPSGFEGTASVTADLAAQLLNMEYELLYSCDAEECGGFDFRFNTEVLLPPDMFVDLTDYFFISGLKETNAGTFGVGILISHTAQSGMVQVIEVGPAGMTASGLDAGTTDAGVQMPEPAGAAAPETQVPAQDATRGVVPGAEVAEDVRSQLESRGHMVLSDLAFETGSSRLGEGPFAALVALAEYLKADETRRVALVGHTDSIGSLQDNTKLSRSRAAAVLQRLVGEHGVPKAQLEARGVGYLAPLASNRSEQGRNANRRVEAVLLNAD